jgi:O-antigen/teichoic acid export membrane protein
MGIASIRFGAEAYCRGDQKGEARLVRTATLIALASSSVVAAPIAIFAAQIVEEFSISAELIPAAILGLRLTCATFVVTMVASTVSSPQLSRLRMGLNAIITGLIRVLVSIGTAAVVYLGYGIAGASAWLLIVNVLGLVAHLIVSGSLLGDLADLSIDKKTIKPMLRFGAGLTLSAIAAIFLVNLEKLLLSKLISVESLAYYTIAFTFASMAMIFSASMVQSLVPAFSQLLSPEKKQQFNALFARSIKLSIIALLPSLMVMFVVAKPFFTIWAGPEYGRLSTGPFYILLAGLLFNIVSFVPYACLVASGQTNMIAKLHWSELLPYAATVFVLITYFGIEGAALAWCLRVVFDAVIVIWMANAAAGASVDLRRIIAISVLGISALAPPVVIAGFYDNYSMLLLAAIPTSLVVYSIIIWKFMVGEDEREWLICMVSLQFNKLKLARR